MKVKFKLRDQIQVAEGIVISYFSQREIHVQWDEGEGLLGYLNSYNSGQRTEALLALPWRSHSTH